MKIELSHTELSDILSLLGGAGPLYRDLSEKPDTPGIFKTLCNDYADGCERMVKLLTERANAQSGE
jgi:hypothetical protein